MPSVRVRFAPSPTGPLHIGGVRTALYNYLFAKQQKGTFIVRIEDTDQKRYVPKSESYIEEALDWLGITADESPKKGGPKGPYRQSERQGIYKEYALQLVKQGHAYYAFDSVEELEAMRVRQKAIGVHAPQYNAFTRMSMKNSFTLSAQEVEKRLAANQPFVIRLHVKPQRTIKHKDQVRGWVQVQSATIDDKILLKEDGFPTYHLANVVDDHLMEITHVIRGEEWLPSTPIHLLIYEGLGWTPPLFAHLPLILRTDGEGKLSKRSAAATETPIFPLDWHDETTGGTYRGFRELGYLKEALINFLALLGWHPSGDKELMTLPELCKSFSLERIHKGGVQFDTTKLQWFNQRYIRDAPEDFLANHVFDKLAEAQLSFSKSYVLSVCSLLKERITFPQDLWQDYRYFFIAPTDYPWAFIKKTWDLKMTFLWDRMTTSLATIRFEEDTLKELFTNLAKDHSSRPGILMKLVRIAVTGASMGPDLLQTLHLLGQEEMLMRLKKASLTWKAHNPNK